MSWKLLCDTEGAVYILLESDRGGKRKVICLVRQDDCLLNVYKQRLPNNICVIKRLVLVYESLSALFL